MSEQVEQDHDAALTYDGETFDAQRDGERLAKQSEAVRVYMASHHWHTLAEIAHAVNAPEASVSARLRDLRKLRFGSHIIERRYIHDGLWEYRMDGVDAPTPEPLTPTIMVCQGCGAESMLDNLTSKWGKPQLVGEIKGKRLMEARCPKCDAKPHKGLQAIWKER